MRTNRRTVLVTALFALLAVSAGCLGGDGDGASPGDPPDAVTLQENTVQAMQDVETATFTMDMTMTVPSQNQELSMTADGAMDLPNQLMRMDMEMNAGRSIQLTQYVVENTMYVQVNGQWQTQDVSNQNIWEQGNQLQTQQALLQNASLEVSGSERVDGRDTWVVTLEPDPEELRALASQQGTGTELGENVEFSNVTVTQYVDVESHHVRKLEMTMDLTAQNESASMDMTMAFDGINEPVTIDLPEEAQNAA